MAESGSKPAKTVDQTGPPYRLPGKRVNLTSEFADLREGLTGPNYKPLLEHLKPEKLRSWNADKTERNALGAYFINRAFERARHEAPLRPPYGLLEKVPQPGVPGDAVQVMAPIRGRSFFTYSTDFSFKMATTVRHDLAADLAEVRTRDEDDFSRRALERLDAMTAPVWDGRGPSTEPDPSHYFIRRGLGTAAEVMQLTANTIYKKYIRDTGRFPDPAWLRATMHNSYRHILVRLAGGHININLGAITDLQSDSNEDNGLTNSFDLSLVELRPVEGGSGEELAIRDDVWTLLTSTQTLDLWSVTTKCPGLTPAVAILDPSERRGVPDYTSPVQGIWNWYTDLLTDAYAAIPEIAAVDKIMALKD